MLHNMKYFDFLLHLISNQSLSTVSSKKVNNLCFPCGTNWQIYWSLPLFGKRFPSPQYMTASLNFECWLLECRKFWFSSFTLSIPVIPPIHVYLCLWKPVITTWCREWWVRKDLERIWVPNWSWCWKQRPSEARSQPTSIVYNSVFLPNNFCVIICVIHAISKT